MPSTTTHTAETRALNASTTTNFAVVTGVIKPHSDVDREQTTNRRQGQPPVQVQVQVQKPRGPSPSNRKNIDLTEP